MAETITVYLPDAESQDARAEVSPRLDTLAGTTIGLVNNGWRSLSITYKEFQRGLRDRFGVAEVIEKRKLSASHPLPDAAFRELVERADAVIVGLGA